jgi:hypothetical protein
MNVREYTVRLENEASPNLYTIYMDINKQV